MDATAEVYVQDEVQCVHLRKLQAVNALHELNANCPAGPVCFP